MYCSVIYFNSKANGFTGRSYTYRTSLDLKVGDRVMVPVAGNEPKKRALVTATYLPESEIEDSWRDRVKEIRDYDYTDMTQVL